MYNSVSSRIYLISTKFVNPVPIDDYSEGDYYGGTAYYNQHILDVNQLYDYLVESE